MKVAGKFAVALSVLLGVFVFTGSASATTFCVPGYFDGCPDNGSNVVPSGAGAGEKLENALSQNGSDGSPDTVYLDSGTYVDTDSLKAGGSDGLTVIGNGRDRSFITSSVAGNYYVVDLNFGNSRHITMKDLAIVIPEDFPNDNGPGSAVQSKGDDFDSVDVINENNTGTVYLSSGFANLMGGGSFTDIRLFGRNGARFGNAINVACNYPGQVTINGAGVSDSQYGVLAPCSTVPVSIDRATFSGADSALQPSNGAQLTASNVLIESGDLSPVMVYNAKGAGTTTLDLDHATVVATGDASMPAIRANVANVVAATDPIQVNVSNSIILGFDDTWEMIAPTDPAKGDVGLSVSYSDFSPVGVVTGDSSLDTATGNIFDSPGFTGITDYHLTPGAPTVDAGDPSAAGPLFDLEGNGRPIDGDFDSVAVPDMGAYELNPPPPNCPVDPSACAPKLRKVKFRYRFGKGGTLRYRVSIKAKVIAVFRPVPKKAKSKRMTVRILKQGKQGANVIKLGKRLLKPGRYRLAIRALNKTGDSSNVVVRKVQVRKAGRR